MARPPPPAPPGPGLTRGGRADGVTCRPPRKLKLRGVNSFSVKSIKRSGKAALTEMRSTVERKYTGQSPSFRETEKLNIEVDEQGNKFVNQYVLIRTIGTGTYGRVNLCLDACDNELRAMKILNRKMLRRNMLMSGKGARNRQLGDDMMREIAILKKLSHDNIVNMVEVIDDIENDKLFIVMEYVDGGPIVKLSRDGKCEALGEELARRAFRQLVQGLDYLHFNKIGHRDLKPDNILVDPTGTVKIADFGVSAVFEEVDVYEETVGTPAFMPPEMCEPGPVEYKKADIWAVGVVLYCMVVGNVPFRGKDNLEIYNNIKQQPIELPGHLSAPLRGLLADLLQKDPNRRISLEAIGKHPWLNEKKGFALSLSGFFKPIDVSETEVLGAVSSNKLSGNLAASSIEEVTFADGDYLMRQGDEAKDMYLITAGECVIILEDQPTNSFDHLSDNSPSDLYDLDDLDDLDCVVRSRSLSMQIELAKKQVAKVISEDGRAILAVRSRGDMIGEMALLNNAAAREPAAQRNASVRASGDVRALRITAEAFKDSIREQNDLLQLQKLVSTRKREMVVAQTIRRVSTDSSRQNTPTGSPAPSRTTSAADRTGRLGDHP